MADRLDLLIEALVSAAQRYAGTPAGNEPSPSTLEGYWTITCGLHDHELPHGLQLKLTRTGPDHYTLDTRTPSSKLNGLRCAYVRTDKGIPVLQNNGEFASVYPCGFTGHSHGEAIQHLHADDSPDASTPPARTSYDHFRSDEFKLSNGEDHFLLLFEVYVRDIQKVRLAIAIKPGTNHPQGPIHEGVAHGDGG